MDRPMIPQRFAQTIFLLILTGCMSLLVSGIATWRAVGLPPDFLGTWVDGWLNAWLAAFPAALLVAPLLRRAVASITRPD
jgi:hypothetical protein